MFLTPLALAFLPSDSAQHAARHLFQHGILSVLLGAGRVSKKVKKMCVCVCTSAPRWPFGLNLLAFCLNSGFFVWRSGPPAAGVGLRENCHLGAFFFQRASLFSHFLRTLARSSRACLLVIVFSWLAVHFPVLRRVGSACAGSAPRPPLCGWIPCAPV